MITLILIFGLWAILGLFFLGIIDPIEDPSFKQALFGIIVAGPVVWVYAIYRLLK